MLKALLCATHMQTCFGSIRRKTGPVSNRGSVDNVSLSVVHLDNMI
jgi:hypothetical protein